MARLDLEVIENNDPTVELVCHQYNPLTQTSTPVNLSGLTVECYVKPSKDADDEDAVLYSSDDPSQLIVVNATLQEHGEVATGAVAKVFLNDMTLTGTLWYHLDVIDSNRRLTYAYGRLKVANV